MQHNSIEENNISTHGKVPRWLKDMSSDVEQNNLPRNKDYKSNNNEFLSYSPERQSSSDSAPNSAKHGRRSSQPQIFSPIPRGLLSLNKDAYIVPKMEEINFNLVQGNFKPTVRSDGTQSTSSLDNFIDKGVSSYNSDSNMESYSPSILDDHKINRKSRLDKYEHVASSIKDIKLNDSFKSIVSDKSTASLNKSNPDTNPQENHLKLYQKYLNSVSFNQKDNQQLNPLSLDSRYYDSLETKRNFEEEFLLLKNKLQRHKQYKHYKKYKGKKNGPNFSEIPQSFLHNTTSCGDSNRNMETQEVFIIPELPVGTIMIVDILSTWGDKFYVGLNGIELFDSSGNVVPVRKISACPEDINILPYCKGDPRVIKNLLDGVNRTQDDSHLWLTPFEAGEHHLITIEFYKQTQLAMLRIWNYNKSRIHSYRGAKDVIITLDGVCIFRGEIAQASGSILGGIESFGDTILFTTEETILEKISINDISFSSLMSDIEKQVPETIERPSTATRQDDMQHRPYTHAFSQKTEENESEQLFGAQRLDIVLFLNWGKNDYIGLTGLEIIGDLEQTIPLTKENLRSNKLAANAMLSRLVDNENITNDRKHMWYTQYIPGEEIVISVYFENYIYIAGIRVWNYNENLEMSFCGVRMIKILLDNKILINSLTNDSTFLLRRAPGNTHYDYVQEIKFCRTNNSLEQLQKEPFYDINNSIPVKDDIFENPIMPEGFVFQIVIYTTWGDQYYVGLNGLEIFDQFGKKILLTENNICAHPESVNVLPGVSGDVRTPDKLVDGINERSDGTHSWLVPVIPKCLNRIYIVFDQPVILSVIKIWNYIKTPSRGVKEFGILVDDLLIYNGILDKINDKSSVKYRTILFTNNKSVLQKEMASLVKHSIDSQATVLVNDEPRVTTGGSLPNADQSLRPFTSVNYLNRERTSQSH